MSIKNTFFGPSSPSTISCEGDIMQWGFGGVVDADVSGSDSAASPDNRGDRSSSNKQSKNQQSNLFSNFDCYAMQNGPHSFHTPSVGVHLRTCGHMIHYSCCDAYLASNSKGSTQVMVVRVCDDVRSDSAFV